MSSTSTTYADRLATLRALTDELGAKVTGPGRANWAHHVLNERVTRLERCHAKGLSGGTPLALIYRDFVANLRRELTLEARKAQRAA